MTAKNKKEEKKKDLNENEIPKDAEEVKDEASEEKETENNASDASNEENNETSENEAEKKLKELQEKYDAKAKESDEYLNMLKRTKADFDNFRKRTNKEKESLFDDGFSDAIKTFLPVLDNLERAEENGKDDSSGLYEGLKMVLKIYRDTLKKSGFDEIKAEGEVFDPDFHNAVLHVEDDSVGEGIIVEVFQKGFTYKGKVVRHSMVKVAN